jgi:chromosome segregation ATPase
MPTSTPDPWVTVASVLLTGGGLKYAYDIYKDWKRRPPKALLSVTAVDASIASIARARDELEEDNARLRLTLAEERAQFNAERNRFIADINRLEAQITVERENARRAADEMQSRYDNLLEQIRHLKRPNSGSFDRPAT